jgi:hypothetical protein
LCGSFRRSSRSGLFDGRDGWRRDGGAFGEGVVDRDESGQLETPFGLAIGRHCRCWTKAAAKRNPLLVWYRYRRGTLARKKGNKKFWGRVERVEGAWLVLVLVLVLVLAIFVDSAAFSNAMRLIMW